MILLVKAGANYLWYYERSRMFSEKYWEMIAIFRDSLCKVAFNTNFFSNFLQLSGNVL